MLHTGGLEAIASVTALRSNSTALIEHAKGLDTGILIQRNNAPVAVLVSYERYLTMIEGRGEAERGRRPRNQKGRSTKGQRAPRKR